MAERKTMVDRDHALPSTRRAQWLGISRGAVHCLPRPTRPAELDLMRRSDELHLAYPFTGARTPPYQLQRQDVHVGRRHIATLMRRMGIQALAPQPGTSKRAPGHKIYPYLLRTLVIERSNQVWALNTTYIPMARGNAHLTAVVDVASRRAMAHKVAITLAACHAVWSLRRPSRAGASPTSPTPTVRHCARQPSSLTRCWARAVSWAWTGEALGGTRSSSSDAGAAPSTSGCTSRPTTA